MGPRGYGSVQILTFRAGGPKPGRAGFYLELGRCGEFVGTTDSVCWNSHSAYGRPLFIPESIDEKLNEHSRARPTKPHPTNRRATMQIELKTKRIVPIHRVSHIARFLGCQKHFRPSISCGQHGRAGRSFRMFADRLKRSHLFEIVAIPNGGPILLPHLIINFDDCRVQRVLTILLTP